MANQQSSGASKSSSGNKPRAGSPGKSGSAGAKGASSGRGDDGNGKSGATQGSTREQHAEAGRQSHKNDDKK